MYYGAAWSADFQLLLDLDLNPFWIGLFCSISQQIKQLFLFIDNFDFEKGIEIDNNIFCMERHKLQWGKYLEKYYSCDGSSKKNIRGFVDGVTTRSIFVDEMGNIIKPN